jgi:hypothetical protein
MEYSTGLMFRAIIEPSDEYTDDNLKATDVTARSSAYYYNYRFYKNLKDLYAYGSNDNILPDEIKDIIPEEPKYYSGKAFIVNGEVYTSITEARTALTNAGETSKSPVNEGPAFVYNGVAYKEEADAEEAYNADVESKEVTINGVTKTVKQVLYENQVYRYIGHKTDKKFDGKYICYYPYIFKHYTINDGSLNTAQKQMTPMKFAVVRNNWYNVTVTGVSAMGRPTPDSNPYTPTPDEETEVWLKVNLKVRDWVVRTDNSVTLK